MSLKCIPATTWLCLVSLCFLSPGILSVSAEESTEQAQISPKDGWTDEDLSGGEEQSTPWWQEAVLWLPNRILDAIDVFRIDVGVGPAVGGVVRVSQQGQIGYRQMSPVSVRFGLFGRKEPVLIESSNEFGIGPTYKASKDRKVCEGEVGLGLDLFLIGGYVGFCAEELVDFATGLVLIDLSKDDIK